MPPKIKLETITNHIPDSSINLQKVIEERQIIKTQLKLLHIATFERDLAKLHAQKLSLSSIGIPDFYFTKNRELIVPVESKIVTANDGKLTLETYLIYLSYLYNIDFVSLYKNNPTIFYKTIMSLNLSDEIKQNLFSLLQGIDSPNFGYHLDSLSTPEFRECLEMDKKRLARELK